jgi:hypothetical protein
MGNKILKNLSISLVLFLSLCTLISCRKSSNVDFSSNNSSLYSSAINSNDLENQLDNSNIKNDNNTSTSSETLSVLDSGSDLSTEKNNGTSKKTTAEKTAIEKAAAEKAAAEKAAAEKAATEKAAAEKAAAEKAAAEKEKRIKEIENEITYKKNQIKQNDYQITDLNETRGYYQSLLSQALSDLSYARSNKTKVYIPGIGWTYQVNQNAISAAEARVENYKSYVNQCDLQLSSLNESNNILKQEIESLEKEKEQISKS